MTTLFEIDLALVDILHLQLQVTPFTGGALGIDLQPGGWAKARGRH